MSKHTPGPWSFMPEGRVTHAAIKRPSRAVAIIKNKISTDDGRLIAAAPDLLEALSRAMDEYRDRGVLTAGTRDAARAAIAKATGQ